MISTATGPITARELGRTLIHEHIFVLSPEIDQDYAEFVHWNEDEKIAQAIEKLRAAKAAGFDTVVDMTVLGMGRNVELIRRVSEASGVKVVVATGLYTFDVLPHFLRHIGPGGTLDVPDPMIDMFLKDATEGIGSSGIKAGVLKCVTDKPGMTPGVVRSIRAIAQVQKATGLPISTHTDAHSRHGTDQQDLLAEEGVDLTRVLIGHCGDTDDLDYLKRIADRGSSLGMDRFGLDRGGFLGMEARVETVAHLCRNGYTDRVFLSHDASCWNDWLPPELTRGTHREMPNWHLAHIMTDVLPALMEHGVTQAQIDQMLFDNPRRLLDSQN